MDDNDLSHYVRNSPMLAVYAIVRLPLSVAIASLNFLTFLAISIAVHVTA